MKVLFDTKKVQKLGRFSQCEQLLRKEGPQEVAAGKIYFDATWKGMLREGVGKYVAVSSDGGLYATKTWEKA